MLSTSDDAPLLSHPGLRLFTVSLLALFLELLVIRWTPTQIRLIAYYANLMLISSFLGLGIGAMLAGRGWRLRRFFLPLMGVLLLLVVQSHHVALGSGEQEARFFNEADRAIGLLLLVEIFLLNTAMFVPIGEQVGELFETMPRLVAYSWDLGGSLAGTLAFAAFALRVFSPPAGFSIVLALHLLVTPRRWLKPTIIGACLTAAGLFAIDERRAIWSSYHYITVQDPWARIVNEPEPGFRTRRDPLYYNVRVNQDFYQVHATLDPARYSPNSMFQETVERWRAGYFLPYQGRKPGDRVLVLGAGGGIDAEAALLCGASSVDAVEIDRKLVGISRRMSASPVYEDPRVHVHIDDGRAFLQRTHDRYDVVAFGFLDSQALFSYGTSIRLDGYVYTVESFRRAFSILNDGGVLSVAFSVPQPWLGDKLERMLTEATGVAPVVYSREMLRIMLVPRDAAAAASLPGDYRDFHREPRAERARLSSSSIPPATDDWPYLYLRERTIPTDYLVVIGTLLAIVGGAVVAVRDRVRARLPARSAINFACLGAGFLLMQTRSISDCSLYFGTTWLVSLIVICGTLLMILAANLLATRMTSTRRWFYVGLLVSLLVVAIVPRQSILAAPPSLRLAWAILVVPLPIFFAGLVFSTTFKAATQPSAALGANLIGATFGGFCEYLGMAFGLSSLVYLVATMYVISFVCARFRASSV